VSCKGKRCEEDEDWDEFAGHPGLLSLSEIRVAV
jgi:hypothetical protein